jgi:hypothetical protein
MSTQIARECAPLRYVDLRAELMRWMRMHARGTRSLVKTMTA